MTNKIDKIQMPDGQVLKLNGGSSLEVCDISMALYVDETKGLRRYINGQIVDINTNTQAFLNRLLEIKDTNPDYFTTEANWQSEATLNIDGCVYKFVLNYSGDTVVSVRLPKYPDYVEINAGGTLPVVGNGMTLGLTDGTTNCGLIGSTAHTYFSSNVGLYGSSVGSAVGPSNRTVTNTSYGITSDPTKSGIQTTLKQTKLKMRYFIQIATGSETENNIINEIELNNPYSLFDSKYSDHELNNLSWLKSEGQWNAKAVYPTAYDKLLKVYNGTETVVGLSVKLWTDESATDYDFRINTAEETFRLPLLDGSEFTTDFTNGSSRAIATIYKENCNGYLVTRGDYYTGGNDFSVLASEDNFATYKYLSYFTSASASTATCIVPITKDMSYKIQNNTYPSSVSANFYPFNKGNGSLYFYVGETVQNANLIDAGRIGEQLATKTDMLQASGASMPSNQYIDLTLGASGSTYTAPANGYYAIYKSANSKQYIIFETDYCKLVSASVPDNNSVSLLMPVKKGDIVKCTYTTSGESQLFRFIYAEGGQ